MMKRMQETGSIWLRKWIQEFFIMHIHKTSSKNVSKTGMKISDSGTARDLKSKGFQLRPYIQLDMLGVGCKSFFKVREMLSVVYAAVTDNVDREKSIRVIGHDSFDDRGLVDSGSHRDRVVPRRKHEIGEGGSANEFALDVIIKCDVALKREKKAYVSP